MSKSIPPLLVEQAALGELCAASLASYRARFGPAFDEAVQRLVEQNEAWSKDASNERTLEQIRARIPKVVKPRPKRRWGALCAVTCACAALFVVLRPGQDDPVRTKPQAKLLQEPPTFRLKGLAPHLTLHRKTDNGKEQLSPGRIARQGDLIQLSYVAAGASHGVVVSVDGRGQATLHFPAKATAAPSLESGGAVPLTQAYELDDAPHFERFFFVTARGEKAPKDFVQQVLDACQNLAGKDIAAVQVEALSLPDAWSQADFLLKKQEGHS